MALIGRILVLEDYTARLLDGRTATSVRRHDREEFRLWVGLEGNRSTHTSPNGGYFVEGPWHLTLLNVRLPFEPGPQIIETITQVADTLLENLGDLRIAGFTPRRDNASLDEFPRLLFVHVQSREHQRLSTATAHQERLLRAGHWRDRTSYHLSQDRVVATWELLD